MAAKKGSFGVEHVPRKLQLLLVVTTDWNYYGYCKGQPYSNDSSYSRVDSNIIYTYSSDMAIVLAEACAVITNPTLI